MANLSEEDTKRKHITPAIEQAGWKGWRNEHVGVYDKQALVLVHFGSGKGEDIVYLAKRIQDSVEEKFGIRISPEVNFV